MDKIKTGVSFETKLNDVDYNCIIFTRHSSINHHNIHYIELSKIVVKKFLFWKYKQLEYICEVFLGNDDSIRHEYYLGDSYYDVEDVKGWCEYALRVHNFSEECSKKQINKFDNYKILTKI